MNTPAGRSPGMPSAPRLRSLQPMAEHHSLCLILAQAAAGGGGDNTVLRQAQHRGAGLVGDLALVHLINESLCILGAGQALAEAAQTKAIMDALAQDAAQHRLALQNDHVADALLVQFHRCGKTCRAAADNHNVLLFHRSVLLLPHGSGQDPGALTAVTNILRLGAQLLLNEVFDLHLAEAALTAAHHGAGSVLDAGHGGDAQRVMDGLQDLRLGHFLTAADHLAVIGILRDELCLLLRRALGKLDDALVVRVKVWVFLKLLVLQHQADDVAGQRHAAGQARGTRCPRG